MSINYNKTEHAFLRIEKDLKSGEIPSLVLLCGKEEYLIEWYKDALINSFVDDSCRVIDLNVVEDEKDMVEKIILTAETFPVMSQRKVIVVPEFLPAKGRLSKNISESQLKELIEYFEKIPKESLVILTAREDDSEDRKKNKIKPAVEKYGVVYDFTTLSEQQLKGFIKKRFRAACKSSTTAVVSMIIEESGYLNKNIEYNLYDLDNDIKKIIAHTGSSTEITSYNVAEVISVNPENNVFAMLDALGQNRKDEAFRLLHNLIESGTPVYNLLKLITGQLELILSVKEMREEGESLAYMHKTLGVHQYRIKKAMAVVGGYSTEHLRKILSAAYDVDENIKTGIMESNLALEYFIAII